MSDRSELFQEIFGMSKKPPVDPVTPGTLTNQDIFGPLTPIHRRITDQEWGQTNNGLPESWQGKDAK
jgi:hypothetical protein